MSDTGPGNLAYRVYRRDGGIVALPAGRFDTVLGELWDDRAALHTPPGADPVFRYNLAGLLRRTAGAFVIQYNPGRADVERGKKRPASDGAPVFTPFGSTDDFQRILVRQRLQRLLDLTLGNRELAININHAPLLRRHFLLIPEPASAKPQSLDQAALNDAFALLEHSGNPCLYLGYNSFGAWASVNHLHFQGIYYTGVDGRPAPMPVARAPREALFAAGGCRVDRLRGFPVRGAVVSGPESREISRIAMCFIAQLQHRDIPHVCLAAQRALFLFPKERERSGLLPAGVGFMECGGEIFTGDRTAYDTLTETRVSHALAAESVSEQTFERLARQWRHCAAPE